MHDTGCIDAAKATFREEMHATLIAPVWDAEAMEAEEAYVDSWAREWLANGTKSCECRQSTHETVRMDAWPYTDPRYQAHAKECPNCPSLPPVDAPGDGVGQHRLAAPDWPSLAHYARHYLLRFCGGHTGR